MSYCFVARRDLLSTSRADIPVCHSKDWNFSNDWFQGLEKTEPGLPVIGRVFSKLWKPDRAGFFMFGTRAQVEGQVILFVQIAAVTVWELFSLR